MKKMALLLAVPVFVLGCEDKPRPVADVPPPPPAAAKPAPVAVTADADALYICTMGAECGKADVKKGAAVPGCCGDPMVKAATYACEECKKAKITSAKATAPKCCGDAPMKKAVP